ncbi:MAG: SDR family NAD(P)-dependent oxidoreductase, partial [Leifsonia sp.]
MILDSFRLDGKVALVSGSSRGIGQGAAIALAEAGADVALLDRGDASGTADRIRALGRRVHPIRRDFASASPQELADAVTEAVAELGGVDNQVNKAGTIPRA